jgi:hypothetical protein
MELQSQRLPVVVGCGLQRFLHHTVHKAIVPMPANLPARWIGAIAALAGLCA